MKVNYEFISSKLSLQIAVSQWIYKVLKLWSELLVARCSGDASAKIFVATEIMRAGGRDRYMTPGIESGSMSC